MIRLAALALLGLSASASAQPEGAAPLYQYQPQQQTRWTSPENPTAGRGVGGQENRGAKGHAFETIAAGQAHVLADIEGAGTIDRIWMTIDDRSPERLRALRLDIYWDGAATPAVSAPLGDFFGHGAGEMVAMETALMSSGEGRSFVSYIPMPFRRRARIVVTNESARDLNLIFYDIDYRLLPAQPDEALYFHAWWSRDRATELGRAFRILPRVQGRGRFLGMFTTVFTAPVYERSWWGEGEARLYLDGDREHPTLVGTGAEDYIGTAWGQGAFIHRFQGAPVADEPNGRWTFYRFHVPDPVFFHRDIEVTLQQIGGWPKGEVMRLQRQGAPLIPVTVDPGSRRGFRQLLAGDPAVPLTDPSLPDGWTNFYRSDDVAAVAYFYLDRPENGLPRIAPVAERLAALRPRPASPPAAPAPAQAPAN
ncbi:MAG TPA: glycoside hydrolase family 172 protein [Allosphingosinicella sp.]